MPDRPKLTLHRLIRAAVAPEGAPEAAPVDSRSDCVLVGSGGAVSRPDSYNYRTFLPERGGLYAVEVFGPVHWALGENRITEDARADRWGHIVLSEPVPHPDAPEVALAYVPVLPPAYRRFQALSEAASRSSARENRDRILANPGGDPPSTLLGELGLWHFEDDRPLTDAEIDTLPRVTREPLVGVLYRTVLNRSNRLRRLRELAAPTRVLDEEVTGLRAEVGALFRQLASMDLADEVRARALAGCALEG